MKGLKIMKTKLLYLTVVLGLMLGFASCDLNYYPSDEQSSDAIMKDASATIIDGCYSLMKDEIEYLGYASGNTYCRHWFQMAEFPADNICISGKSTDPLFQAATYNMTDNLQNVGTIWMVGYKIIYMTNTLIENLNAVTPEEKQILGEAYFVRALVHLNMVTLFAKPYSMGTGNLGVPLRLSSTSTEVKRNTVGEVYNQVVEDLKQAASLMSNEGRSSTFNAGYPCKNTALGLLSRVYLYMENYAECSKTVESMLNGAAYGSVLETNFVKYFANAKSSKETLFCIAHELTEDRGQSSIGSMYNAEGGGWGEIYPSVPLLNLYERYPMDIRYAEFIRPQYKGNSPSPKLSVYFPSGEAGSEEMRNQKALAVTYDEATDTYSYNNGGKQTIEKRLINGEGKADPSGEYFEYHVNVNGEDLVARILPSNMVTRNSHPKYFVTKFGYQDGSATLSSPVVLRWAEVLLNAAESYARSSNGSKALEIVNAIRTRAGIPAEGLFSETNMHGYTSVIDVVMDERRLELAFEGHRMFDVYRNKQNMNRQYPGYQPWKIVNYTDPHTQYPIPNGEWTVSHIEQNPGY